VQRLGKLSWILRHVADRSQLNALVSGSRALGQHLSPGNVAVIVGELDTPGTRRIGNSNGHPEKVRGKLLARYEFVVFVACDTTTMT